MKKKWTWSQMLLAAVAVALLVSGSTFVSAKPGGGGGKPPKDDPPPPPTPAELPDVRYRIKSIQLPANANGSSPWINYINNLGQVVGVYSAKDGRSMFVYDPLRDPDQAIDMNVLVTAGVPDGWRLRSGIAINDHMVVVGNMEEISTGQVRPVAIDLATVDPVVDLLPDVGVDKSHGYRINENGDILGAVQMAGGGWASWIYNPGLYGDPEQRAERTDDEKEFGVDMRGEIPELLFMLSGRAYEFKLNNPVGNSPAQIAGEDADGIVFRYTLGDADPELFPEVDLVYSVAGLNDSGTFCGVHRGPKIKGKIKVDPFRFNEIFEPSLELLQSLPEDGFEQPSGFNSSGDVLTYSYVYRDDWGWVKIDDLVVGDYDDMQVWSSGNAYVAFANAINDRGGPSNAGQITGNFSDGRLFVLTPEPAQAP